MSPFHIVNALIFAYSIPLTLAAPTPSEVSLAVDNALELRADSTNTTTTAIASIINLVPSSTPSSIQQVQRELQQIYNATNDLVESATQIILNGLAGGDFSTIAAAYQLESSSNNTNLQVPATPVYPSANAADAPYSLSEAALRGAVYIPTNFTYGKIPPVLLLPGTACISGQNYGPNYGKLFNNSKIADPVYVNIPNYNLDDIQLAAEYVAYATNYISSISGGKNVSTISFSMGSISGQWALKYWPSVRNKTSNKISISGDYHGTFEAYALCPGVPDPLCDPAIVQQTYNSTFVNTLRNHGGDSAYVPTTNIYSIFDEVVQPQEDPIASASLNDTRGVGVSNIEVQKVCSALLPSGTAYTTHEGLLYNALAYALAVDAIQNGGPGQLSRIDVELQCLQIVTPGLSLADVTATEALAPLALTYGTIFLPKVVVEPPIMAYALGG